MFPISRLAPRPVPVASALLAAALVLGHAQAASAQTLSRGPILENPSALPTTMTVSWWTDVAGNSTVEYGLTAGLGSTRTEPQAATCEVGAAGTCHLVELTGLTPGTTYFYRLLVNGVQVQATQSFTTLRTPGDPADITFAVIGDWGQGTAAEQRVANIVDAKNPQFLITVGDNAYTNGTQSDWDTKCLPQYANVIKRLPFFPALGNHDLNSVGAANWQNSAEIKTFHLPRNAPAGQEERFYAFDHGDARFIVLDSDPPAITSTQTTWLENELQTTSRKWKFVFLHHTPYSCASGLASIGSDLTVRGTWGPLFEQYGVDIVFVGHDHNYERSLLMDDYAVGGGAGPDGKTTLYVQTGGGGATLDGDADIDGSGHPVRTPLFGSSTPCYWLAQACPSGPNGYCSFSKYQHTFVRIVGNNQLTAQVIDDQGAGNVIDTVTITKSATCGDGVIGGTEQCDEGAANGTATSCCTVSCGLVSAGTACRAAAGTCDQAETCTGSSGACPADVLKSAGTSCRASAGACDLAETCSGSSAACPADVFVAAGATCRASAGVCDVAETCSGSSAACPANAFASAATGCRAAAGACDVAENCTGSSATCPADILTTAGTTCRGAAGLCDLAETCTGSSPACPADGFVAPGTVCRAAVDVCDAAESCSGSSAACPADALQTAGTACTSDGNPCTSDTCDGSSVACTHPAGNAGATCRAAAGACDLVETCDGSSTACPADVRASAGTVCRAAVDLCDAAELCSGSSATCPGDLKKPAGTACRAAADVCDAAEACNGSSNACPADLKLPAATVCRAAAGDCDAAETCTGASNACPADTVRTAGTACTDDGNPCTSDACDGVGTACTHPAGNAGATCRAAAGVCDVAETCSGSSATCPADTGLPDGDGDGVCNAADRCPSIADPAQADGDGDGLGDACDPCTGGPATFKAGLKIGKFGTPAGDDLLVAKGQLALPFPFAPPIDPVAHGVRLIVTDAANQTVLDVTVPGGPYDTLLKTGWKANGAGTAFTFKSPVPVGGAITKAVVRSIASTPGLVSFQLSGRKGGYLPANATLPLSFTMVIDPPFAASGQCTAAAFPGPKPVPACTVTGGGSSISCR